MDLMDFDETVFNQICADYSEFAKGLETLADSTVHSCKSCLP